MLTSLHIERFRGLQGLSVEGLARVNLFVGANQSGKTSLLDAVQLVSEGASAEALYACQARRNERFVVAHGDDGELTAAPRLDSMFHGARLEAGSSFAISASARGPAGEPSTLQVRALLVPVKTHALPRIGGTPDKVWKARASSLAIQIDRNEGPALVRPLPHDVASLREFFAVPAGDGLTPPSPVDFVTVAGLDEARVAELWGEVVLTPSYGPLLAALRRIEPGLEDLALVPDAQPGQQFKMMLKLREHEARLSLGDMGEGFRRLLGLFLCMPRTRRSELLVDEIDTGLHYSMLGPMWRAVIATARERDLQVFATTHSLDCVAALGRVYDEDPSVADEVAVHRLDRGYARAARYTAEEISTAAQHHIEVRG